MKNISFTLICSLILACTLNVQAQQAVAPGQWQLSGKFQEGFIIAHRPSVVHLQRKHVKGFEIDWLNQTNGEANWHHLYNFPVLGFGYQFFDLGNQEELGNAQSLIGVIYFPLLNKQRMRLNVKFGLGVGYIDKPFNLTDNYKNQTVGSHVNAVITTGAQLRFRTTHYNQLLAGIDLTHFSNGSSKIPNMGINIATVNIGYIHCFGEETPIKRDSVSGIKHQNEFTILAAMGAKELNPPGSATYGVGIFTGDWHHGVTQKSKLGAGTDLFIDNSVSKRLAEDEIYVSGLEASARWGVHLSYGLEVGKCSGYFQTGYYLYTKIKNDGNIYSQLSLRYLVTKHVFACFNLKSHYAKADYFEYGIGYKI
jgi:Lipid A 3-O-deacylase (PagL)